MSSVHLLNLKSLPLCFLCPSRSHAGQLVSPATASPPEFLDLQLDYWTVPSKLEAPEKMERLVKKDSKASLKTTFRSVQVFRSLPGQGADPGLATLSMMMVTKEKKQKSEHTTRTQFWSSRLQQMCVCCPHLALTSYVSLLMLPVMRLGKRSKDSESKSQVIDGINRLICTSKSQSQPITGKRKPFGNIHSEARVKATSLAQMPLDSFLKDGILHFLFAVTIDGTEWLGVKFFQLSGQWQTHVKTFPVLLFDHTDATL